MATKRLVYVILNSDLSTNIVIEEVILDAIHYLYMLHIEKNATQEIKNYRVSHDLVKCMLTSMEIEVFEVSLIQKNNIQNNKLDSTYKS